MRIHLSLNGIFSYFPTKVLTLEEVEEWESYPVVFITPDGDDWDPYTSHFADNEAAMLNWDSLIVDHDRPPQVLFTKANLCKLYGEPVAWDVFDDAIGCITESQDPDLGSPLPEDEVVKLNNDGIHADWF